MCPKANRKLFMTSRKLRYLSFLLRLWPVKQNGGEIWRASLENPRTGERRGFASLELLMAFLHEQIQAEEDESNTTRFLGQMTHDP